MRRPGLTVLLFPPVWMSLIPAFEAHDHLLLLLLLLLPVTHSFHHPLCLLERSGVDVNNFSLDVQEQRHPTSILELMLPSLPCRVVFRQDCGAGVRTLNLFDLQSRVCFLRNCTNVSGCVCVHICICVGLLMFNWNSFTKCLCYLERKQVCFRKDFPHL